MKKGKIIVIEGADGTGKATQTQLLKDKLLSKGYLVDVYDFPQYTKTFFGALVGRFLKGDFGTLKEVNPHLASVLYAADRWQSRKELENTIKKGKIALLNRYALSNMAFQGAKVPAEERDKFLNFLEDMEYIQFGIPKEDLNIVLTLPPEISQKLIEQKDKRSYLGDYKKKDIHEDNLQFQLLVAQCYKDIAKKYKHMRLIDCSTVKGDIQTKENIHKKIWKIVEKYL
jgi:dTMP kinase